MGTEGFARSDLLVDPQWLESHLGDINIRVVDCDQYEMYRRAHIPNAVGIPGHHYIKHSNYATDPVNFPLVMPPKPFTELMEEMGIGDDTLVVAYDSNGSLYAARFWWVLNYYGHTKVKVLNGGWVRWFSEGRPIAIDTLDPPTATFTVREESDLLCSLDYGVSRVGESDTVFLDVRSDGEWESTNPRGNRRVGHVPGAVHLEWRNFVNWDTSQTLKNASELIGMLEGLGITLDKQVITY